MYMLNKQGFDLWAEDYDKTVKLSEESNQYPFAGYKQILNTIFNEIMQTPQSDVLDIGFGTAILTSRLYNEGHHIDGIDFSTEMITIAEKTMPKANLYEFDINQGLPQQVQERKYNSIISTYALHHLSDEKKFTFVADLLPLLKDGGQIYIGDIAFETRAELDRCQQENRTHWDDDEFYFIIDEFKESLASLCQVDFHKISHCGGVIILSN